MKIKTKKSSIVNDMKKKLTERMKFNIWIDAKLLKQFKLATMKRDITMTDAVSGYMRKYVKE